MKNKMNNFTIPLEKAQKMWAAAFQIDESDFFFTPAVTINLFKGKYPKKVTKFNIENWIGFEDNAIEWNHMDFARLIGLETISNNRDWILITDEGLLNKIAYNFRMSSFDKFVEWYELEYSMEFFQSADYILFDKTVSLLFVLHHEGVVFRGSNE